MGYYSQELFQLCGKTKMAAWPLSEIVQFSVELTDKDMK